MCNEAIKGNCNDKECKEGLHLWSLRKKPKGRKQKTPSDEGTREDNEIVTLNPPSDPKNRGNQRSPSDPKDKANLSPSQKMSGDQTMVSNSFLERLEATIRSLEERQTQTQDQIKEIVLTQKREKELQPPEWFLRWNIKAQN